MITCRHPTTILITGPTQAGKTLFLKQILEHQLIQPSPSRVIYVFSEHAPNLTDLKHLYPPIEYLQGMKRFLGILPTMEADERSLVVLDDQMSKAGKLEETSHLFSKGCHHRNITLVYIVKNVFDKGMVDRTVSLNSHNMLLLKNPLNEGQIGTAAQQLFPTKVKFFMDSFREATKKYHGYLLVDLLPLTPDPVRFRTTIFKSD